MKVMLAMAPWDLWDGEEDTLYPNGLAALAAILEKNNHEVSVLSLSYSKWDEVKASVEEKLKREQPDIFGISILSNSRISAQKMLDLVKKVSPNSLILAGGVHTTCMYEQVLNHYPIDYAVLGEADKTIIELINSFQQRKSKDFFKQIKGIAFKHNGEIIKTEPQERIRDLDSLPIPKYEFFKDIIEKYGVVQIMTSRGCPFSCAFCPSSVHWGRCITQRSAEKVFEEIEFLLKKFPNLKSLQFMDDEFVCNNQRVIHICKMMIDNNIKTQWTCAGRVTSITDEVVSWMKKAGCDEIIFGVESGSQRILNNIGKNVKVEQIVKAFEICKRHRVKTRFLSIVGLPGENAESVNETIRLAKKLKVGTEPAILIVYPGTRVYELAKEKGMMTDEYWLGEGLPPLYVAEHSKLKLWWWSFKTGLITYYFADDGNPVDILRKKFLDKMSPYKILRLFRRYISDKT